MSEGGQRGPGSGGTAHRGRPGAGQARQNAGGESPPGDGQDHAGTPRPDALIPALDEGQPAALCEIGRAWDRVSADPQVWRQALPADPSLGEYPEASEVRPALFSRFVPVAGRGGRLPPIETTGVSETPLTALGRAGPPLDATAIVVERMRKLLALPVLSADALSSVAYGPQAMLAVLVLAGLPRLSYSLPVGAAIAFPDAGGRDLLPPDDPGPPARRRVLHRRERGTRPRQRRGRPLANYLWTLHEQWPDLTVGPFHRITRLGRCHG
jgi:hypothetical protein